MERSEKLRVLADSAKYDASCASSGVVRRGVAGGLGNSDGTGICHSYTPDGRCVSLLKILFTNFCIYDCQYCINRISRDQTRDSIEGTMAVVREHVEAATEDRRTMRHPRPFAPAGQTTQMIVGASASSDAELLRTASELYAASPSPTSRSCACA